MAIKSLEEKKNIKGLFPKLFFLGLLLVGGILVNVFAKNISKNTVLALQKKSVTQKIIQPKKLAFDFINNLQTASGQVMGAATQYTISTASKSATMVSDFIYQNTLGKIVEQVKVLPKDQRERIKKEICR
jgi:hypothetical protein